MVYDQSPIQCCMHHLPNAEPIPPSGVALDVCMMITLNGTTLPMMLRDTHTSTNWPSSFTVKFFSTKSAMTRPSATEIC